jgi:hypothetical protein
MRSVVPADGYCLQAALPDFLDPEARKFFDALPDTALVWRGCEKGRERGGQRVGNMRPTLVQALIPKPHIFAVFLNRDESEIVLDPQRQAVGSNADIRDTDRNCCFVTAATFPPSALRRALRDNVNDLKRHHYLAGLIDYLDERGDRAAIRF